MIENWMKYFKFVFLMTVRLFWLARLVHTSPLWHFWAFHHSSDEICALFSLPLRLRHFGGEVVLSCDAISRLFCCRSFGVFSFSPPFESLHADRSGGVGTRGSNFGDIELEGEGEICIIRCLVRCCSNAFSKRNSSNILSTLSLRNAAIDVTTTYFLWLFASGHP